MVLLCIIKYYWLSMREFYTWYVQTCDRCEHHVGPNKIVAFNQLTLVFHMLRINILDPFSIIVWKLKFFLLWGLTISLNGLRKNYCSLYLTESSSSSLFAILVSFKHWSLITEPDLSSTMSKSYVFCWVSDNTSPLLIRSVIGSRRRQQQITTWTTRRVTRGSSVEELGRRSPGRVIGGQ